MPIGIDLGGTKIAGIRMADDGCVLSENRIATPKNDYAGTLDAIVELATSLDSDQEMPIGIGTPGACVPGLQIMQNCNSEWLNGKRLLPDLETRLGKRVRLANDADCFALSEAHLGAGRGYPSVFGVILGTGVGGGFVVEGRLLSGPNALTGEWGHTPLPYFRQRSREGIREDEHVNELLDALESALSPRTCYCGRLNCIETFLSGPGLARTHQSLWGDARTPEELAAALDDEARKTFDLYCHMLARSLAQVVNIVDPHVIVLGGGLSKIDKLYPRLSDLIVRYTFSGRCKTPILAPVGGDASGVRGAAWLWLDA